jgi:hypothetical protein
MPGTVEDFMQRFGGGGAIDDKEAEQYYDRFASTHPNDWEFDKETMYRGTTEYLGQLPDQQFQEATYNAFAQAPRAQQQGLLGSLLSALQGRGVQMGALQGLLGLPSLNPQQMGPDEYARLANYARTNHPDVMGEQVRSQPWLVKAMGNPIVMGALGAIAAKMLQRRNRGRTQRWVSLAGSSLG